MHSQRIGIKNIKHILNASLVFSLAFFINLPLMGQTPDSRQVDDTQNVDESPQYKSLFWEINGDSLAQPSYLFGTIHMIPKDSFFMPEGVKEKLESTKRLVLEIPLDMNPMTMIAAAQGMIMPEGKSLQSLYTEEEYTHITSFLNDSMNFPLPPFLIERVKPLFISQIIATNYCDGTNQESYELYFKEIYDHADKPISGLETAAQQMEYLNEMSLEDQAQSLLMAIENPEEACKQSGELVTIYRKQDLNKLLEMMGESEEVNDALDKLLDERNKNWIPKIEEMIAKESIFIAVGAGHLPGKNGVIELLRRQGYSVTPLYYD